MGDDIDQILTCDQQAHTKYLHQLSLIIWNICISTPIPELGLTILMIHNYYKEETIANAIQRPKLSKELEHGSDAHNMATYSPYIYLCMCIV